MHSSRTGWRSTDCWSSRRSGSYASSRRVCRSSAPNVIRRQRTLRPGAALSKRMSTRRATSTFRAWCTRPIWASWRKPTVRPRPRAWARLEAPTTSWARTAIARRCCSRQGCPSCETIRASHAYARGWGSSSSGWQRASGLIAPTRCPMTSRPLAKTRVTSRKSNSGSEFRHRGGQKMKTMLAALVAALALADAASAQPVADHLECYKVKDSLTKKKYTADLDGLVPQTCTVKVPAVMACVPTDKTNVMPTPPGGGGTGTPNGFFCYKVKCPKATLPTITGTDQFGTHTATAKPASLVCAPIAPLTATTTSTTTTTTTCGSLGQSCSVSTDCCSSACSSGVCCVDTNCTSHPCASSGDASAACTDHV